MSLVYIRGVERNTSDDQLIVHIRNLARLAFDQFRWLKPDKLVWLKVALNSCDPYPATTDWRVIRAFADEIISRGGRVVIADESGIEYDDKGNELQSPSEYCYAQSGMSRSGAEFEPLEKLKFDFFTHPLATHWPEGFRFTCLANVADHIINLPRVSAHGQAGVTLGFKSWVGALYRADRYVFHSQGPLYWFIQWIKLWGGEKLPKADKRRNFYEMIVELSLAIRPKLRGTFFVGTKVQATMGPNKYLMTPFKLIKLFPSHVFEPEVGLLIASDDPVAAETVALAFLMDCYAQIPWFQRFLQKILITVNGRIKELGKYLPCEHPFVSCAYKLGLGHLPSRLMVQEVPSEMLERLRRRLYPLED